MKKILLFLIFILVLSTVKATDFLPYGDISGKNTWQIYNFTNITANDYICVAGACYNSFAGSGTVTNVATDDIYLTGGPITATGTVTLNESKLNSTMDARETVKVVDVTQGLTLTTGTLNTDQSYFNLRYNQTSSLNVINSSLQSQINLESINNATQAALINLRAGTGTCSAGEYVQNTTTSGVECLAVSGGSSYDNESPISLTGTTFGLSVCPNTQGYFYNTTLSAWQCQSKSSGVGGGTVTSVDAGVGMDFSSITSAGNVDANMSYFNVRFNETSMINAVNSSLVLEIALQAANNVTQAALINTLQDQKLNTTDQRFNETSELNAVNDSLSLLTVLEENNNNTQASEIATKLDITANNYTTSVGFSGTTTKTLTLGFLNGGSLSDTFTDIDTTYSAGNGISLATTTFSVAGNTCLDQDADGLSVTDNCIGNTQLQFDTGQELTTTSTPTFASLSTGQGQYELYAMNQNVRSTDAVTFSTIDTGNGATEIYDMNQDIRSDDSVTFLTVNTGQGANELYDMDQNVLTTSDVTFDEVKTNILNLSTSTDYSYFCTNSTGFKWLGTNDYTDCLS